MIGSSILARNDLGSRPVQKVMYYWSDKIPVWKIRLSLTTSREGLKTFNTSENHFSKFHMQGLIIM